MTSWTENSENLWGRTGRAEGAAEWLRAESLCRLSGLCPASRRPRAARCGNLANAMKNVDDCPQHGSLARPFRGQNEAGVEAGRGARQTGAADRVLGVRTGGVIVPSWRRSGAD